jgi:hypothetical protein
MGLSFHRIPARHDDRAEEELICFQCTRAASARTMADNPDALRWWLGRILKARGRVTQRGFPVPEESQRDSVLKPRVAPPRRTYPGLPTDKSIQRQGRCVGDAGSERNPVGQRFRVGVGRNLVEVVECAGRHTQGSSFRGTLGWRTESRWDSSGNRSRNIGFRLATARLSQAAMADPILEAPGSHPGRDVPRRVLVGARMRARTLLPGFLIRISAGPISP